MGYNRVSYSMSGFQTMEEAEVALKKTEHWFASTYKPEEWQVVTTIQQGPYGFRISLEATKDA